MAHEGVGFTVDQIELTTWVNIVLPDLRNGNLDDITDMSPTQYIATSHKWASLRGARHEIAEKVLHPYIMSQYGQLVSDFDYTNDVGKAAKCRKASIIMGSVRCSAFGAHRLTEGDMTRAETIKSGLNVTYLAATPGRPRVPAIPATDTTPEVPEIPAVPPTLERITVAAVAGDATNNPQFGREVSFGPLTPIEKSVAKIFFWMGAAIPLLQGASLIHSGHHYIPTTYNMFQGLVKQASFMWPPEIDTWLESVSEEWKGWAFHDATHPIVPDRKRDMARSHMAKKRLELAGHKAAIIRLPGLPAESQALKAGIAVIVKASSPLERLGAKISVVDARKLLDQLEGTTEGMDVLTDADLREKIKDSVRWYEANQGHIAYCAGVVDELHTQGAERSSRKLPDETTTKALSVRKAISNNISMYVLGQNAAAVIMSIEKKKLESEGKIELLISV